MSHVIAVIRRAVTQPRRSGQLPVAAGRRRRDVFESLRLQAKKRLLKGNNFSTVIYKLFRCDFFPQAPKFPQFEAQIKSAIARLGGKVFAKLNWSSPKVTNVRQRWNVSIFINWNSPVQILLDLIYRLSIDWENWLRKYFSNDMFQDLDLIRCSSDLKLHGLPMTMHTSEWYPW